MFDWTYFDIWKWIKLSVLDLLFNWTYFDICSWIKLSVSVLLLNWTDFDICSWIKLSVSVLLLNWTYFDICRWIKLSVSVLLLNWTYFDICSWIKLSVSVFCLRILSLCALASRWRLKEGLGTSFILILCKHKFKLGDLFMKTVFQLHEVNHNVTQYLQNQFISKMFFLS